MLRSLCVLAMVLASGAAGAAAPRTTVYSVSLGWHTGLLVPARLAPTDARRAFPRARWLLLGFGSRRFYMARHPTLAEALEAVIHPSSAVIYVVARTPAELADRDEVRLSRVALAPGGGHRLARWLRGQFVRGAAPLGRGAMPGGDFFGARAHYDALQTCNTWVAEAFAAAGLALRPGGVVFAWQLRSRLAAVRRRATCTHSGNRIC